MGMSASALSAKPVRLAVTVPGAVRHFGAVLLARAAYALFYVAVLALVLGIPAAVTYLGWYWLEH